MSKHERFRFKSAAELKVRANELGIDLPWSDSVDALFHPADIEGIPVPNRFAVQPMEGFDSDMNGTPGEPAFRRYGRYAAGGSGMIWFEAVSVSPDGRSNPHQMMITEANVHVFGELVSHIRRISNEVFGRDHRPFLILQLTHSGRYSHPDPIFKPKIFSSNPYLDDDQFFGVYFTDKEIDAIKEAYVRAMFLASDAGFDAVDIKACHGYLLHEMLFAYDRTDSRYGGTYEGRTSFLRDVLQTPAKIGKAFRLSAFDRIPFPYGFGMKRDGSLEPDLEEVKKLIEEFAPFVPLWNISAGIPRYNAFVGRPFDRGVFNTAPPQEHPLEAISRLISVTGELQKTFGGLHFVGSGYSWLRQYFPSVGAGVLEKGFASFIGLGRSSFAYPDAAKDLMVKGSLDPAKVCVSCSKCTEFMRLGVYTGCAVRDPYYRTNRNSKR